MRFTFFFGTILRALPIILLAVLPTSPFPSAQEQAPRLYGSTRMRVDDEGVVTARMIVRYGPSRWFLLGRSDLTLTEEVAAPAGYRRSAVRLRSPLEGLKAGVGVEAGPLIIGPIQGEGLYRRLRDPTIGGARWSALTDPSRFTPILDPLILDRRGAAFALGQPAAPLGFAAWYLERDSRFRIVGVDGSFSPLPDAALGRAGLLLARVTLDPSLIRDPMEEPWSFTIPPVTGTERRLQALYWVFDHRYRSSPTPWQELLEPHVLVEGWRQRSGYAPPLFAGTSVLALGPPVFRVTTRIAGSGTGFRTLENGRPRHSRLAAADVSHRSVYPVLIFESGLGWTASRGWENERPGPRRDDIEFRIAANRLRIIGLEYLDRLYLSGFVRRDDLDSGEIAHRRLEIGSGLVLPAGRRPGESIRVRSSVASDTDGRGSVSLTALYLYPTGRPGPVRGRPGSMEVSGTMRWEEENGNEGEVTEWSLSAVASVPLGERTRLSARIRVDGDAREEYTNDGWLVWSGNLTLEYIW